uniref:Uncharacterized protein n=1 Tax=Musca domestica TaxID=7370 RepID=A0A1I8N3Q8_MUSDO
MALVNRYMAHDLELCGIIVQNLIKSQQNLNKLWFLVEKVDGYFAATIFLLFIHNGLCIVYTVNWAYLRVIYEPKYTTQMVLIVFAFIVILIQFKMEDVSLGALYATQKLFGKWN